MRTLCEPCATSVRTLRGRGWRPLQEEPHENPKFLVKRVDKFSPANFKCHFHLQRQMGINNTSSIASTGTHRPLEFLGPNAHTTPLTVKLYVQMGMMHGLTCNFSFSQSEQNCSHRLPNNYHHLVRLPGGFDARQSRARSFWFLEYLRTSGFLCWLM